MAQDERTAEDKARVLLGRMWLRSTPDRSVEDGLPAYALTDAQVAPLAALIRERDEAVDLLRDLEPLIDSCPICGEQPVRRHAPDCRLAALIQGKGKASAGWISVNERLPSENVPVLASWAGGEGCFIGMLKFNRRIKERYIGDPEENDDYDLAPGGRSPVTHWMPLPPPPGAAPIVPAGPSPS